MNDAVLIGLIAAVAVILIWIFGLRIYRIRRRRYLMRAPFPPAWEKILRDNLALYRRMPDDIKKQLRALIRVFVDEKNFVGCGGLQITDAVKVIIAAEACLLLVNTMPGFYPRLSSILVYPGAFIADNVEPLGNQWIHSKGVHLGESWGKGFVVLAWDEIKNEAMAINGGRSVVIHEFAHQLDQEKGAATGVPILRKRSSYATWARVFSREYARLRAEVSRNIRDVIDDYGAENPAEFFAVVTEAFFEKSAALKRVHPKLYVELQKYFKMDPAQWTSKPPRT